MKTAETVGCFFMPLGVFYCPVFLCPTPRSAPRFVSRRMPGGAYDKIRASDRVACGHVGAGAYAGTPPCAKNPLFPTDVLFFRLLEKMQTEGAGERFPWKTSFFRGEKQGAEKEFRKEKRRCKRIAFANGFSGGYSSMPSKMPPVSRSFQSISPSCRRIYEWGESSLGRETEPQLT